MPILYQRFLGWANEFDTASNEQKKMIICGLCDRIEVKIIFTQFINSKNSSASS